MSKLCPTKTSLSKKPKKEIPWSYIVNESSIPWHALRNHEDNSLGTYVYNLISKMDISNYE